MRIAAFALLALEIAAAARLNAQTPGPTASALRPVAHVVSRSDVSGIPGKEGVMIMLDWAPGATTGRHFHHGDEYAYVIDGSLELRTDGAATRNIHSGESYHNAEGVVHETVNSGLTPARSFTFFVVDKGKPLSEPVP